MHEQNWLLLPWCFLTENPKANPRTQRKERTQNRIPFVLIRYWDRAVSTQRRKEGKIYKCLCACPGLRAQNFSPTVGLRSSQPAGELNVIIWGQKGQKVNWGTDSVGSWVCDCEETRLRAGGVQRTGEELARLWTCMTLLGLTSKWTTNRSRNHGPSLVLCTSIVAGPLSLAEKKKKFYVIQRMN